MTKETKTKVDYRKKIVIYDKLQPLCFKDFSMSITNEGYLVPCCYCDDPPTMEDPEFKKLLAVSKIKDYDNLEDIFYNKEWIDFYKKLENNIAPCDACLSVCTVKKDGTKTREVRKDTHFDTKDGTVKRKREV